MSRLAPAPSRATSRPRWAARAGAAALASLTLAGCGSFSSNTPTASGVSFVSGNSGTTEYSAAAGPRAPGVSGTTLAGARLTLAQLRGHVVVMNFWGSWCTPCRAEAPALAALDHRLSGSGVRFLGVDVRDSTASAEAFMSDFGITYPSLSDPGGQIALAFRDTVPPAGIPTTLVISPGGRITARVIGEVSYRGLQHLITRAEQPS